MKHIEETKKEYVSPHIEVFEIDDCILQGSPNKTIWELELDDEDVIDDENEIF